MAQHVIAFLIGLSKYFPQQMQALREGRYRDRTKFAGRDLTGTVLLDVVYADWPTPLARAARERGATVVSGLEMLVHQAARQFELFTGEPAPVAQMQAAGRAALGESGHTPDA